MTAETPKRFADYNPDKLANEEEIRAYLEAARAEGGNDPVFMASVREVVRLNRERLDEERARLRALGDLGDA